VFLGMCESFCEAVRARDGAGEAERL